MQAAKVTDPSQGFSDQSRENARDEFSALSVLSGPKREHEDVALFDRYLSLQENLIESLRPTVMRYVDNNRAMYEKCDILRFGGHATELDKLPGTFIFEVAVDDHVIRKEPFNSGLEGFVYEEKELREDYGQHALEHHLDDYFQYLKDIFARNNFDDYAHVALTELQESELERGEKYQKLVQFVERYVEEVQTLLKNTPNGSWIKQAHIYQIFPRQYNLAGARELHGHDTVEEVTGKFFADFSAQDFEDIKQRTASDTVWIMGVNPIGLEGRKGAAGGSPYSIKDPLAVNPDYGTEDDFKKFVRTAHDCGMKVMMDFVPNHTSMDSELLKKDPTLFVHQVVTEPGKVPPEGSFEYIHSDGTRYFIAHGAFDSNGDHAFFEDTAQLDHSNPNTREALKSQAVEMVKKFDVDGFRVDMSYCTTEEYRGRTWDERYRTKNGWKLPDPQSKQANELLAEIRESLKEEKRHFAFCDETYDKWNTLSLTRATVMYGKNNIARTHGKDHVGFNDALIACDPAWLRDALDRLEFLNWQCGGPGAMSFANNHDEPELLTALRKKNPHATEAHAQGALTFTALAASCKLTPAGEEIGVNKASFDTEGDEKALPFTVDVEIDWSDRNESRFVRKQNLAKLMRTQRSSGQTGHFKTIPEARVGETEWVGYYDDSGKYAVLWNPTNEDQRFSFQDHIHFSGSLPPGGFVVFDRESAEALLSS